MPDDSPASLNSSVGIDGQVAVLGRRGLLRGGAVLAGAAAGAAAVALAAEPAHAADGDNLVVGADNTASSTTSLAIGGDEGTSQPTLTLQNANGPSLKLQPLPGNWSGELQVGEMVGTDLGPEVGVDSPSGLVKTPIATLLDLAEVPSPFPTEPSRKLDLRIAAGRDAIVRRSSADALTADGRLRAQQWIDVSVVLTGDDYDLQAVFANLTVVRAATGGWASLYRPGVRPETSNLNWAAGQTLSNAAMVGTGVVQGHHVVRLFTITEAWFVLDVTGGVGTGTTAPPLSQAARARAGTTRGRRPDGRTAVISKMRKAIERSAR